MGVGVYGEGGGVYRGEGEVCMGKGEVCMGADVGVYGGGGVCVYV